MTDQPTSGDANTPSTDPTQRSGTHPAADASAMRKLGSGAGDPEKMNLSGHGREGTTEPGSPAAARHDIYWRRRFAEREYADESRGYEYYRPAYRYGWESRDRHGEASFDEIELELRAGWEADRKGLPWEEARPAVRDAFEEPPATEWSDPGNPLA